MKKIILLLLFILAAGWTQVSAQGVFHKTIIVKGDANTYYPVRLIDSGYYHNVASEIEINRSNVHTDSQWRGSEMAWFRFHIYQWGNGADYIDAKINQGYAGSAIGMFVAGWQDVSRDNSSNSIIVWLKGGTTTYYLTTNYDITPFVYDGVTNPLPYILPNSGAAISTKTAIDPYVNNRGLSYNESAYFNGVNDNYFQGNVGIGTLAPAAKLYVKANNTGSDINTAVNLSGDVIVEAATGGRLTTKGASLEFALPANADGSNPWGQGRILTVAGNTVNGQSVGKMVMGTRRLFNKTGSGATWSYGDDLVIDGSGNVGIGTLTPQSLLSVNGLLTAQKVKVTMTGWADYVFEDGYHLPTLQWLESYVKSQHHLPDIPAVDTVTTQGLDVGEMNQQLLKKVEELTLYLIDMQHQVDALKKDNQELHQRMEKDRH